MINAILKKFNFCLTYINTKIYYTYLKQKVLTKFSMRMYDFYQPNYLYHSYENGLMLRNALKECKTEEEKEEVMRAYQGATIVSLLATFVLAVVVCGILSLFT